MIATDRPDDVAQARTQLSNVLLEGFGANRLALIWRVLGIALREHIELLLVGHVNYAPLGWLLKRLRPQVRYGVILYGVEAWQQLSGLRRRAVQQADFLISISDYTKQMAAKQNRLNEDLIHLLPNSLESNDVEPPIVATITPRLPGIRMLSVCRLDDGERYKGVDKVIEVMPQVIKKVPDIHYDIVGGGSDLARHQELARKLGVADRVHFLGFLQDESLQACYRNSDLFVMPSSGEGFGFVFLEAMQHRKPIVAANCTAVSEVVENGISGLLVERDNPAQLAEAIVRLCQDAELRKKMGAAGFARVQQNFTFDLFKKRLVEILAHELPANAVVGYRHAAAEATSAVETL